MEEKMKKIFQTRLKLVENDADATFYMLSLALKQIQKQMVAEGCTTIKKIETETDNDGLFNINITTEKAE